MVALNLALQVALLVLVGAFIRKKNIVDESFEKNLSKFIMSVALPALIIDALSTGMAPGDLKTVGIVWAVSLGFCLVIVFIIGTILYRIMGRSQLARVARFALMIPNFTFMGIPVIQSLYGSAGLVLFNLLVVPVRLVYYLLAKPLLNPQGEREKTSAGEKLKNIFSPLVISVIIGLILGLTGIRLPQFIAKTISSLAAATSSLGMVMCGMILSRVKAKDIFGQPKVFIITGFRIVVLPAIALFVMMLLPLDPLLKKIVVIYCALPVAALIPSFVVRYDNVPEARLASSLSVFSTTLLSVITLPIWYAVVEAVF